MLVVLANARGENWNLVGNVCFVGLFSSPGVTGVVYTELISINIFVRLCMTEAQL